MDIYLVGGAVRDKMLNYPYHESDWVVVGAKPVELLEQGFQQVGRDFPVFIHPKTGEEYALARTERKHGQGYHAFSCDYNPAVSLVEDLARRDLTINAMAMDKAGHLIDPYHGLQDLRQKVLRHVSSAFIEDPVRVLRVARFAARYHHLGFTVADETLQLMYRMVINGELSHLVPERVWQEWQRSLCEKNPEIFVQVLRSCGALDVILPELNRLFGIPNLLQSYHEVDCGFHSLQVLKTVVAMSPEPEVRFAALTFDLGKIKTPITEWPEHPEHGHHGVDLIDSLSHRLRVPSEYRNLARMVCRYHQDIFKLRELQPDNIVTIFEACDAFRRPKLFNKMLIVCEANDKCKKKLLTNASHPGYWQFILQECSKINASELIANGYQGAGIKAGLHQLRVQRVSEILSDG